MVPKLICNMMLGLAVPILGSLFALPSAAQVTEPDLLSPMQQRLLEQKAATHSLDWLDWPASSERTEQSTEQPIELVLQLTERQLYVYRGDRLETTFPVAIGKDGWETPTGSFEVDYMLENPGWTNPFTGALVAPGPENPLGERWIAFWTDGHNEIGFHGTPNRESIGQATSHGCVRLYNEHVRALYALVSPGTRVTVLP